MVKKISRGRRKISLGGRKISLGGRNISHGVIEKAVARWWKNYSRLGRKISRDMV